MLEIENLGVRYGHHLALEGVSARVEKGEICVMLGANGAGKSSLLKAIAGMIHTVPGSKVVMNGKTITGMKPHRIVEEGIALVPEGRGIFGDLTVAENLQLGAFARRARDKEAATLKQIYELFPRLAERKGQVVRTMSGGEQQMVAIGRALMSKPEILMLDEPSLGLSPLLCKDLFKSLSAIAETGVGILLVEQNAKQSLKIADRGYLIENGLITGENTAAALASDPAVVNAYLGGATQTGRGARRGIRLPAPFALPGDFGAMRRFLGDVARRAGAIHAAFIRFVRREAAVPSAFVGRYDPEAGGDPWENIETEPTSTKTGSRPMVSTDARNLSAEAERMARSAGERLARHVNSTRLSGTRPSAFEGSRLSRPSEAEAPKPPAPAEPTMSRPAAPRADQPLDIGELTRRATVRLAEHVRRQRQARTGGVAARPTEAPRAAARTSERRPAEAEPPVSRAVAGSGGELDAAALARRAGQRLSEHLKRQREAGGIVFKPSRPDRTVEAQPAPNGPTTHAMLGHNSAGFDIDAEEAERVEESAPGETSRLDFSSLAERAAAIHASHLAERRRKLSIQSFPAAPASGGTDTSETTTRGAGKAPGKPKEN